MNWNGCCSCKRGLPSIHHASNEAHTASKGNAAVSFKVAELRASFIPGKKKNAVGDRYAVIRGSATWLMCLLLFTLWLILHFTLKPFHLPQQKLSKQTSGKIQNKPEEEKYVEKKHIKQAWQFTLHVFSIWLLFFLFSFLFILINTEGEMGRKWHLRQLAS